MTRSICFAWLSGMISGACIVAFRADAPWFQLFGMGCTAVWFLFVATAPKKDAA